MALIEIRSTLDDVTNSPLYGNCTLSLGDGTVHVKFENGRAMVEQAVVEQYLINNGGIEIPSLGIWRQRGGAAAAAMPTQDATSDLRGGVEPDADAIAAAIEQLDADGKAELLGKLTGEAPAPAPAPEDEEPAAGEDPPQETDDERRLRESAEEVERLKKEGELEDDDDADDTPSPRVVPAGFNDLTGEGEPRCLAKTGSGSQCKNAAVDGGSACKLAPHQKQFA